MTVTYRNDGIDAFWYWCDGCPDECAAAVTILAFLPPDRAASFAVLAMVALRHNRALEWNGRYLTLQTGKIIAVNCDHLLIAP